MWFWGFLVVFAGLLSTSHGSLLCMESNVESCTKYMQYQTSEGYCANLTKARDCFAAVAADCSAETTTEVKDVLEVFDTICKEGTDLHEDFLKYGDCLVDRTRKFAARCHRIADLKIASEMPGGLSQSERKEKEFQLSCRYKDPVKSCIDGVMLEMCGQNGFELYQKWYSAVYRLEAGACLENKASLAPTSLKFILLQTAGFLITYKFLQKY